MNEMVDWGTSGFKALTWRKVELVRDLILQVSCTAAQNPCVPRYVMAHFYR